MTFYPLEPESEVAADPEPKPEAEPEPEAGPEAEPVETAEVGRHQVHYYNTISRSTVILCFLDDILHLIFPKTFTGQIKL